MKRTPPWVFVAAVGVQLAALGLCVWAMESVLRAADRADDETQPRENPWPGAAPSQREALAPAPPPSPADAAFAWEAPPSAPAGSAAVVPPAPSYAPAAAEPRRYVPHPAPAPPPSYSPRTEPPAYAPRTEHPPRPLFGPPPYRTDPSAAQPESRIPAYLTELADGATQLVGGTIADRDITFGFYPDGNIRFVDVDGARYFGKAESARARMREEDGIRSFTVQIGVAPDGRLQATFAGGLHDAATFPLEPLVGWSVA